MIREKQQKLRLLTEWMDYFILLNKDEIIRSLNQDGVVFIQQKLDDEHYEAEFGLMVLSNQQIDLTLRLVIRTGEDAGKSFWFDIRKRDKRGDVFFNENTENKWLLRYDLERFLKHASHQAFAHLEKWVAEAGESRRISKAYEAEAEQLIQETLTNFYLDARDFEALAQLFPVKAESTH